MGNRRVILFLLAGIVACALLLWGVQRHMRFMPEESKARVVLFERPLDALIGLKIELGDMRVELYRQNGEWMMYSPFPSRVDQGAVSRIVDAFENAPVNDAISFQDLRRRELSLKEFGLAPAVAHVTLQGESWRDELRIGVPTPLGKEVYVRLNALDQIFVVPSSVRTLLPRSADDLRSRKLVHCDRTQLRSIELRTPGHPFIKLSKTSGVWRLVQPISVPASDDKVDALLDVLYRANVERFVWPTVSNVLDVADDTLLQTRLELYGFGADTAVQVHLQEADSDVPAKIVFGRSLDDADAYSYALLQGGDTVGTVSNGVVKALNLMPSDLRDTRLFFEKPDGIRRLQILFGDQLFVLGQTNALWQIQAPVSDIADQRVVKDSVEQLLRLKADRIVDESVGESQSATGERSPPICQVGIFSDRSELSFSVAPEDFEGKFYRFSFTNSPAVYIVASSNIPPAFVSMIGLLGLRDKTVLALQEKSIRRISVKRASGNGEVLVREKDDPAWVLGDGVTGKVNAERLSKWLALVCNLKADRIEKLGLAVEDADRYGLRAPWLEVGLDVDSVDTVRKTLLVGKDAGFGKRYAAVRGLDVLFVLSPEALQLLANSVLDPL